MIRAMLLYDFLGQRVLFGETHALTYEEAVTRLRTISVEANLGALTCVGDATFYRKEGGKWVKEVQPPTSASLLELFHPGAHPPSAVAQRPYRSTQLYRQYTHERRLLQAFLRGSRERGDVLTTDHLVNYVMEKRSLNAWDTMTAVVEGLIGGVELSFLSQTSADGRVVTGRLRLTCGTASDRLVETVDVTERVGVLPALLLLCGNAVRSVTKERVDWDYLQTLLQPTLWDGRFPAYTPEYYYAPNFLGELLQGVCGKYTCRYETVLPAASDVGDAQKMEGRVRTVFYTSDPFIAPTGGAAEGPLQDTLTECRLSVACLTGVHNGAEEGFLLGIGRGRTRKEAWWAASCAALNANFPSVVAQLEDYKQFCEWRRDPGMLLTLGAPFGLRMRHSSRVSEGHTVWAECAPPPTIAPASVIHAYGAATSWTYSATAATPAASFAAVMDEMRRRLKVKRADNPPFALWEDSNHYRKSVWHALCGAVAIASKGKSVTVQFEFAATADPTSADFTLHLVRERLVKLRVQKETSRYEWRKDQQILLTLTSTQVTELIHGGKAEHSMLHFFLVTVPLLLRHTLLAAAPPAHVRQETNLLLLLQGQYGLEGRPLSLKRRIVWCVKQWTGCPCAVQVRRGGDGGWSATLTVQVPRYERRVENTDRPGRRTVCLAVTEGRTADRAEHALWRLLCQTWGVPLHKEADASDGILSDLFL
ncbi:hypothetical protein, conserved [Angomonas deanei]|uniref:Uncharacterized protein n=1 Tax=Angomonas deanei TaxID=59799 RepID=A0A7G2CRZ1_9TRYP|nr:hypothetical protein, conserved [Angomonas deanei]